MIDSIINLPISFKFTIQNVSIKYKSYNPNEFGVMDLQYKMFLLNKTMNKIIME